jgi:cellulose synthase/poly-beta-1,6-N-acetylglucosamine synthase-like glycosyltransferase
MNVEANFICLDPTYSTTRLLTQQQPVRENPPDAKLTSVLILPEGEGRKGEGGLRTQGYFKQSLPDKPLITIITSTYNAAEYLPRTIKSVREQTYTNIEWIIVDGNSKDNTVELIRQNEDVIDYWVSEPDSGIYDAWNKGVSLANGDWIAFLGAGDSYKPDAINVFEENKGLVPPVSD